MLSDIDWPTTLTLLIGAVGTATAAIVTAVVAAALKIAAWRSAEMTAQLEHDTLQKTRDREMALSLEERHSKLFLMAIQSVSAMGEKVVERIENLGDRVSGKLTEQTAAISGKIEDQTKALKCGYSNDKKD